MANHKSALKRNRQNLKKRANNRSHTSHLRSQLRKIDEAFTAKNTEEVKALLSPTISLIDKSIQKGVLHKNAAARHKSRLMSKANGLQA
jgi:small subunit ribosomal protein S20